MVQSSIVSSYWAFGIDLLTVSVDGYNMIIGFDNKYVTGTGAGVGAVSDSRIGLL